MKRICVFTGSSPGARADYAAAARQLAGELVSRGLELVYGGATVGLMGVVADTVLELGGCVTGVIPEALVEREIAHSQLTDLRVVESMHQRKALMEELSCGFVALPGGLGTLDEIAEIMTWAQLGLHAKPYGFLNVAEYYDHLLQFFAHSVGEQFVNQERFEMIAVANNPGQLLDMLERRLPP